MFFIVFGETDVQIGLTSPFHVHITHFVQRTQDELKTSLITYPCKKEYADDEGEHVWCC
jgi:hypothetical protein